MPPDARITKLTNCRLVLPDDVVRRDLWVSGTTGRILDPQTAFYDQHAAPATSVDLGGRLVAPGFIDLQLNGYHGMDFSVPRQGYARELRRVARELVRTGVTSYMPTLTSQRSEVYRETLPYLGAPRTRNAEDGAESLGAHCEGPFINKEKNGIHKQDVLQKPSGIKSLEACYGEENLRPPRVTMVTLAPELDPSDSIIQNLRARGITVSIGHSTATHAQAVSALRQGATMITHLYNAMPQPHHREAGIIGLIGSKDAPRRPWFGLIADNVHVHPSMVRVAYSTHPKGCVLVTDAMAVLGLPDASYPWTNGETLEKTGSKLTLKGTDGKLAGSAVTLIECLNNLIKWTDVSVSEAMQAVTLTPAKVLGIEDQKGQLKVGADADLVVLSERQDNEGIQTLEVDEVWKFGVEVHQRAPRPPKNIRARL